MKRIKSLFLGKKHLSNEEERRLIEEIVKEDEKRRERLAVTEKQKIREADRARRRIEIEREVREKYLHGERGEIEAKLKGREVEGEKMSGQRMEVAGEVIKKTADVNRVCEPDATCTTYGYSIIYKKTFQGRYWRVFEAKRKDSDQTMSLTIVDLMKAPSEKRDNLIRIGLKITRFLASNPHPTLVNVYDLFLVDTEYYLFHEVMETCLEQFMRHGSVASELRASIWGWELADAITYLHSHGIAHRNISPKTVWMKKSLQIKLGNFSYSTVFWDHVNRRKIPVTPRKIPVTPREVPVTWIDMKEADFLPPEECGSRTYDAAKADVWMWASTVVYMLTKKFPPRTGFNHFNHPHLACLSYDATSLLSSALQTDFSKRPSASSILHNIWFKPFLSNPSPRV